MTIVDGTPMPDAGSTKHDVPACAARRVTDSDGELAKIAGELLDRVAARVAERVLAGLAQPERDIWLSLRDAAEHLGVHSDTLRRHAKAGLVPFEQDAPGCKMFFLRSQLDAWRAAGGAAGGRARLSGRCTSGRRSVARGASTRLP
jgi:excisionase family DNA binding protein